MTVESEDEIDPGRNEDDPEVPVDDLEPPRTNPVEYLIDCIETDSDVTFGPLDPSLCREAQRIIDAARESARRGETVALTD
jgi:glucose-fructose oxidoreductase